MPVVINEFEVVDKPPAGKRPAGDLAQDKAQTGKEKTSCADSYSVARALHHWKERLARVRAH